ncbi:hypothetical protein TI39_contig4251g00010 [Zymoseptoria brevis]|uniref:Transcriptional regulatory protein RXT2 N-terminal domain-containing protein n=1 Tax=Zymoseptoria brevis TaxID=1047168 RepID=A0A0F4G8W4_9PEZI|nr:hypothetical protein TI39_contig4251g00010 [Zymoseptoria brevis]
MAQAQMMQFADTIASMKLALKRRADDSGSDSGIQQRTNRGNKLKRRARNVQEHRLDDTGGLNWRRPVNHAGFTRKTISSNPPFFDDDGDPYSPTESDYENDRYAEPAEDDPFVEVRLADLLRPLTSAADLATHPSLRIAYTSTALTQMTKEALEMLRRENANLWKAKRLLQRFRGDADWVPCEAFETEHDTLLLQAGGNSVVPSTTTKQQPPELGLPPLQLIDEPAVEPSKRSVADVQDTTNGDPMEGVDALDMAVSRTTRQGVSNHESEAEKEHAMDQEDTVQDMEESAKTGSVNGVSRTGGPDITASTETTIEPLQHTSAADPAEGDTNSETGSNSNGTNMHAMTTRARARSPAERTPSPSPSESASVPDVHPWFIAPAASLIDRDLGLPAHEAEDTRKLLLLYVQKQEQVVRSLNTLHEGLQKADRERTTVYRNCKAEGHVVTDAKGNTVTDMSDGEDWYDVEDWGLQSWELKDGALEKGKDEVEDVEEERRGRPGRGRRVNRI